MDTIIVVLFLLLPTIFGMIGKKFEAAGEEGETEGQQPQAEPYDPMKKLAEMLGLDDPTKSSTEANEDRFPMPDVFSDDEEEGEEDGEEEPVYQEPVRPEPVYQEKVVVETPRPAAVTEVQMRARLAAMKTQAVVQEEKKKQKMEIDPKKLVIYSEIMKPKYLE
jgi:hypothetical protein